MSPSISCEKVDLDGARRRRTHSAVQGEHGQPGVGRQSSEDLRESGEILRARGRGAVDDADPAHRAATGEARDGVVLMVEHAQRPLGHDGDAHAMDDHAHDRGQGRGHGGRREL